MNAQANMRHVPRLVTTALTHFRSRLFRNERGALQRVLSVSAITVAGLLAAGAAHAASLLPPEVFFGAPDIQEAKLSPSGKRLAITSAKGLKRVGLVVLDLEAGGKITRLTQSSTEDVVNVHWVNDERLLFSLADLGGERSQAPGLFAINADGSALTPIVGRRSRFGGARTPDYSVLDWSYGLRFVPDMRPGEANEEVLLKDYDHGAQRLTWVNTRTVMTRAVTTKAPGDNVQWLLGAHGEPRATVTFRNDRVQAYWLKPGTTEWEQLYDTPILKQPFQLAGIDGSGALYVTYVPKGSAQSVLTRYDAVAKAPSESAVVATPGFDFAGELLEEGGTVLGVRVNPDGETTVWLDPHMAKFQQEVDKRMPGLINRIACRRCGQTGMVALVNSFSDHDPGTLRIFLAQPPAGEPHWKSIGRIRESVLPEQMAAMDFQTIKARDGHDMPVWITRPDDAKVPRPAVVLVHGGPWIRGNDWRWHDWGQFLASRGYVVIEPEFRGSLGYGDEHFRAGLKQWGQAMQDDVTDALRWAQKQGLASDKACIIGGSYGGYSVLMGLAKDPGLYRCGAAWMAVSDLTLMVEGSWWIQDDGNLARRLTLPEMVGDANHDAAMIAANSPVNLAARIQAPLLLAHGNADRRVPMTHATRMRDALVAAGHPPEWITYADEGHGFSKHEDLLDFATRLDAFLGKYLQP
jgi:dipeptidyl aminopeptidase/acylaminoacyl peptidase